jgi:hypothetical protein
MSSEQKCKKIQARGNFKNLINAQITPTLPYITSSFLFWAFNFFY